ncbi:hypothetical protein KR018_011469, partial [Drosophila ironensis]
LISRLAGAFKNAMLEDEFVDCRVVVGSRVFHCHKVILGIASDFFKRTFLSDFKEAATGELVLNTIKPETFEKFRLFVYTYDKKLLASYDNNTIIQLLECAQMWFVPLLLNACTKLVIIRMKTMTLDDLLLYFEYSHQAPNEELKCESVARIKKHKQQLLECQNLSELGSDTFKELLIRTMTVLQPINMYKLIAKYVSMMGFKVHKKAFQWDGYESDSDYERYDPGMDESDTSESEIEEPGHKRQKTTIHREYVRELYNLIDFGEMTAEEFHKGPGQDTFLTFEEKYNWLWRISTQ